MENTPQRLGPSLWYAVDDRCAGGAYVQLILMGYITSVFRKHFNGFIHGEFDVIIELVAIELNFWQWTEPEVPIDYLTWFVVARRFD